MILGSVECKEKHLEKQKQKQTMFFHQINKINQENAKMLYTDNLDKKGSVLYSTLAFPLPLSAKSSSTFNYSS